MCWRYLSPLILQRAGLIRRHGSVRGPGTPTIHTAEVRVTWQSAFAARNGTDKHWLVAQHTPGNVPVCVVMLPLGRDARAQIAPDLRAHGHQVFHRDRADTFVKVSDLYLAFSCGNYSGHKNWLTSFFEKAVMRTLHH